MDEVKILIVEDESITALGIKQKLQRLGYCVVDTVPDGEAAIKKTAQLKPHLILMDILLKGEMDGIETASRIRENFKVSIVYLTAHSDDSLLERARLTMPDGYIIKPFSDADLKSVIEMALFKNQQNLEVGEDTVSENEEKYRTLFNSSPDNVIILGADGKLMDVNQAVLKNTGLIEEDLIGKHFSELELLPQKDIPLHALKFKEVLEKGYTSPYESRFIDKEGNVRNIEIYTNPIKKDHQIIAIQIISHDITNLKKANKSLKESLESKSMILNELKESEEKFRQIADNIEEVFWIIDSTMKEMIYVSPAYEEIWGRTAQSLYDNPQSWLDNIHADDREKTINSLFGESNEIQVGSEDLQYRILRPDNEIRWILAKGFPITNHKGEVYRIAGTARDITDLKNAQEAIKLSETYYKTIFENTGTATLIVESDDTISLVNSEFEKISHYPKEEIEGKKSWIDFIAYPDDVKRLREYQNLRGKDPNTAPRNYEFKFRNKKGEIKDIFTTVSIIPGTKKSWVSLMDITEKKRSRKALARSEEKYRQLVENAQEGICSVDPQGIITFVNPRIAEMLGYSTQEMLEKPIFSFIHDKQTEVVRKYLEAPNDTMKGHYEFEFVKKDGNTIFTSLEISLIRDEKGDKIGILALVADITKSKKAENALKESIESKNKILKALKENEEYMERIFATVQTGIIVIDAHSKEIMDVNRAASDLIGLNADEIKGRICHEFICPSEKGNCPIIDLNQDIDNSERVLITANREEIPIIKNVVLITLKNRECILESFIDIRELKELEKSLQESREKYKVLIEASPEAIMATDMEGNINFASPQSLQLLGFEKIEDIMGKNTLEFIAPKYHKNVESDLQKIIDKGNHQNLEYKFVRSDGTDFIGNVNLSIIRDYGGNPESIIFIVRDVTGIKNAEEQIKASLKEKEVLLREIHHRVKNNLQIISSLLSIQSGYLHDEQALDIFTESQNRIRSMAMIHEKLYKSKSLVKINFRDYVNDLTEYLFYNYKISPNMIKLYNNIEDLSFDINTAIPCGLIINELVTNCIKHAFPWFKTPLSLQESSENLEFGKYRIDIQLESDHENYVLSVADNGVGFPQDIDFENTDSLGLKLVKNLVEQLEGKMTLDNTSGTKFTIVFSENNYEERI